MGTKKSRQELVIQSRIQNFEAVDRRQEQVSAHYLEPVLEALLAWVHRLRAGVDQSFQRAMQTTARQAAPAYGTVDLHEYPKGFCGPIRDAILQAMMQAVASAEECSAPRGLKAYLDHGGICKAIHGIDVTGPYFQNAIQLGPYYLDVANDTVDIRKPPILFERITATRFENIPGLDRYFQVAKLYLRQAIFPNRFFPWLSPIAPAFIVNASGYLELPTLPMGLAAAILLSDFRLSHQFLASSHTYTDNTLPGAYTDLLAANQPSLADDPLLAVTAKTSTRVHDTFQQLRALGHKSPDKYLFYFQHYQAVLTAQRKISDMKLRPDAEQIMELRKKGLVPGCAEKSVTITF